MNLNSHWSLFPEFSLDLAAMMSGFLILLLRSHLGVFCWDYGSTTGAHVPTHFRSLLCLCPEPRHQTSHHRCLYSGQEHFQVSHPTVSYHEKLGVWPQIHWLCSVNDSLLNLDLESGQCCHKGRGSSDLVSGPFTIESFW